MAIFTPAQKPRGLARMIFIVEGLQPVEIVVFGRLPS
jgi:hypothetical protein